MGLGMCGAFGFSWVLVLSVMRCMRSSGRLRIVSGVVGKVCDEFESLGGSITPSTC